MLHIVRSKTTLVQLQEMAKDLAGYIKVVVDVDRQILVGGGERHVDGEQKLLTDGSKQVSLWGGGFDVETKEIDYNSIINLRPQQGNPSRDILSETVRKQFDTIIRMLLF